MEPQIYSNPGRDGTFTCSYCMTDFEKFCMRPTLHTCPHCGKKVLISVEHEPVSICSPADDEEVQE